MSAVLRKPQEWAEEQGYQIADADGWRGIDAPPFEQPITKEEFELRSAVSTIRLVRYERSSRWAG